MDIKHVKAFGDSLLVMQQISGVYQCSDVSLNAYLDKCLEIIATFDDFTIQHIFKDENTVANDLAQQASDFWSNREKLYVLEKSDVPVFRFRCSDLQLMNNTEICSIESSSTKLDVPELETGGSGISKDSGNLGEMATIEPEDWMTPLVCYLKNPGHITDRNVWRQDLKYVLLDNDLYRRTIDGLLLK
jgi:hypothetical protein